MHRLVIHFRVVDSAVVTLDTAGAMAFDRQEHLRVRRVRSQRLGHRAAVGLLNSTALLEARRFSPDAVLSGHVVTSPAAWLIRRVTGRPFVQYVYAQEFGDRPRLSAFAVRRANAVVAISRHSEELARAAGADPRKVVRIPPGVDPPNQGGLCQPTRPVVLTISRLSERYKGHDRMIEAMPLIRESVPDALWVVIGDGPLREEYERQVDENGLNKWVRFLGWVDARERDAWLARARVFAMPSRMPARGGGEGFGIVYLEAAAHGLPVVAGNVGGALDAVVPDTTGLLVDPDDPVALGEAISFLLLNPEIGEAMGRAGAKRAREFAWPSVAQRVERILLQVAGSPA